MFPFNQTSINIAADDALGEFKINDFELDGFQFGLFDRDLIDDPDHPKRFQYLATIDVLHLDWDDLEDAEGNNTTIFAAWGLALIAAALVSQFVNLDAIFPEPIRQNKELVLLLNTAPKPIDETPEAEIKSETQLLDNNVSEENTLTEIIVSEPADLPIIEETPAPQTPENADFQNENRSPIRMLITDAIRDIQFVETENQVSPHSIQAPGVVFDSQQKEQLASPYVEKLNQGRVAPNASVETGFNTTATKIGNTCLMTSQVEQSGNSMDTPLVGNGMNIGNYRRVDCDDYFNVPSLNRGDIKSPVTSPSAIPQQ